MNQNETSNQNELDSKFSQIKSLEQLSLKENGIF